jgi:hypothetical protein
VHVQEQGVDFPRPLSYSDFERVLEGFRPSGVHAHEYRQQQASNGQVRACGLLRATVAKPAGSPLHA